MDVDVPVPPLLSGFHKVQGQHGYATIAPSHFATPFSTAPPPPLLPTLPALMNECHVAILQLNLVTNPSAKQNLLPFFALLSFLSAAPFPTSDNINSPPFHGPSTKPLRRHANTRPRHGPTSAASPLRVVPPPPSARPPRGEDAPSTPSPPAKRIQEVILPTKEPCVPIPPHEPPIPVDDITSMSPSTVSTPNPTSSASGLLSELSPVSATISNITPSPPLSSSTTASTSTLVVTTGVSPASPAKHAQDQQPCPDPLAESFLLSPSSDDSDHDSDTDTGNSTVDSVEVNLDLAGSEEKETITNNDMITDFELKMQSLMAVARQQQRHQKSYESAHAELREVVRVCARRLRPNVTPSINAWNHFQQQHGGKGWSSDEMASKYHEQRSLDGFPH